MDQDLKIIFWNVRGLNCRAKCSVVRTIITSASPTIVCLSETKLPLVSLAIILKMLGPLFADFFWLPAIGTRGGILLAWRLDHVNLSNPSIGSYHVSAMVSTTIGAHPWWVTGVYGPQADDDKIAFLNELQELRATMASPWLLGGDFNMVTSATDKNNGRINHRPASRFRRFIADHALRDIYMHGRCYTWSSEQQNPTLVRNDRVLCTTSRVTGHPQHLLRCLTSAASDHCPLVVDCSFC